MNDKSFNTRIEVSASPAVVFDCINAVPKWFKDKGYEGHSAKLNDEFIFEYGDGGHHHFSRQKLVEFVPGRKVVWLITESQINWIPTQKEEWTNTRVIFEIRAEDGKTVLNFTHAGLVPELECYTNTCIGWNIIIGDWLFNFINENAGK